MWFNIQIRIQDHERIYASFINESYNEINNKLTLSFEVFITNVIDLFQKERASYSSIDKFENALRENEINEIVLSDLEELSKVLDSAVMYKGSYTYDETIMLDTGGRVFFNRYEEGRNGFLYTRDFKNMLSDTILDYSLTGGLRNKLRRNKDQLITYLVKKTSSILSIKVIPKDTKRYEYRATTFSRDIFKDISENLAHRYAVLPKPGKVKNLIVDSFLPQYFIKHKFNLENIQEEFRSISPTATMIHRGFARMLGIRELPLDDMLAIIGYTKQRIAELLTNVKAKKFNIAFAGYGGVGTNTVYWLTELCNMTNIQGLFNKIIITDFDKLSLDNVFRMPNPFKTLLAVKREDMNFNDSINNYRRTEHRFNSLYKTQTIAENSLKALSAKAPYIGTDALSGYTFHEHHVNNLYNWVVYGAPDIESRRILSEAIHGPSSDHSNSYDSRLAEHIKAFISATHGDDICELSINPSYLENESNLMIESYGIIQLNVFFFNQLRLAIAFLEVLERYSLEELEVFKDIEFLKNYSIVGNQKSNKYNIAFQNVRTINTVENIERES